jgi:hypothetical protein
MTELVEFLKSTLGLGLLGLVCLIVGFGFVKGISGRTKQLAKVAGIALVIFAAFSYMNVPITLTDSEPAATVSGFDVVGSESHSYVTVDQAGRTFTWSTAYDHTGEAIIGATQATFVFSITRALGTVGTTQVVADVTLIPDVTNTTTAVSASLISKTGLQYNAIWQRPDSTQAIQTVTATIGESSDGVLLTLNLTINGAAIRNMAQYEIQNINLIVAGEPWTVSVLQTGG